MSMPETATSTSKVILVETAASLQQRPTAFLSSTLAVSYQNSSLELCTVQQSQISANISWLYSHNNSLLIQVKGVEGCVDSTTDLSSQLEFQFAQAIPLSHVQMSEMVFLVEVPV